MNSFRHKLMYVVVIFLCTLVTLTEVTASDNPFADLFDAEFGGFFASAGIGYGITQTEGGGSTRTTAAQTQAGIGYAISERLGFYVTSILADLEPQLGLIWFPAQAAHGKIPRYYLKALIGYSSQKSEVHQFGIGTNTLSIDGGIGYEFRRHFVVEATVGYRQTELTTSFAQASASASLDQMRLVAAVNYLFY